MDTPIRGQPPYNGQTACPLTNCLSPAINCPYISTSDEGNLQTMDKMLVPTVSIILRFHCIAVYYYSVFIAGCETIH